MCRSCDSKCPLRVWQDFNAVNNLGDVEFRAVEPGRLVERMATTLSKMLSKKMDALWVTCLGLFCCVFGFEGGIIIIIAFKGAIRDFRQSPHSAANCLQHARSSGPGAIVCKSRATHRALIMCKCHVTCHLVRRDSSAIKFDRVEIAFI